MSFGDGNLHVKCEELERALIAEQVENERLRGRINELEQRARKCELDEHGCCTRCEIEFDPRYAFCPWCGAKVKGGVE